ncbi:uncharacterized protein N7515_008481 [Penicillium bovifimosum]|uniref:Zn(2)-C6 fungal-type domain-containing protein n=1 Tax=Penicillium bovifimosum TaxID=126998 RepID=A0A9W9GN11_9EURO|nr:uncharacterized protein N7515_008481 [Penicillium bovifimosum]KAJ5124656.1 hypothetical protein N7515_008481 [Penicillium bovifimosum]
MTARQSTPSSEHSHSDSNVRKRVCKACDRCRLKKSKCDGSSPCSRCRADNAICVFGERKKAHDKVYPKGYVEMLEQQQTWLVNGLQELYRRNIEGEGWPGEHLKLEPNGQPLTHDLLMRLGALDGSKGERFEENPEALQQELWHTNTGMQRQESSDGSSDSPQSPAARSRFSSDAFSQQHMPPTPPTYSPSTRTVIKTEPGLMPSTPHFAQPMAMQGVVNPLVLQGSQQWPSNGFNSFDEMDLMSTADYSNMSFDDQQLSPMFNRQVPMNCISQGSYVDSKTDYDDFNQFLNPNPTEITSI